jgi:hypothetical protein
VASAIRGLRKTENGVESVADPIARRIHRRVAIQISAGALGLAGAATAGLILV